MEAVSLGTSTASDDVQIVEQQLPTDAAFVTGRTFGDAAALVQGILQMIAGGGAIGSGGALCFTGIGCIAGSGAVAAGVVTATHGASVVVTATGNMARDLAELINAAYLAISSGSGGESEQEPARNRRTDHAEQRRSEGRSSVSQAFNDAQRARQSDIFVQPDDGRYVVRGPRGREHIFEPDGSLLTTVENRPRRAHLRRVQARDRVPVTNSQFERFMEMFR